MTSNSHGGAASRWVLCFRSFGLLPTLSAYENVELMLRITACPARSAATGPCTVWIWSA